MAIVGYAQDPDVSIVEQEAVLESFLRYPEIKQVLPGSDFCKFGISEEAPKSVEAELTWFVEQAHAYLTANIVLGDFSSAEQYQAWHASLDEQQAAALVRNRAHLSDLLRVNRLIAGLTTESFAKQLASQNIHDRIIAAYSDFSETHLPQNFYAVSLGDRLQAAMDMEQCLIRVIRLLEQADFIKCHD